MKFDFWQITDDPVEKVVALIARRVLDGGARLLVVSEHAEQRAAISRALWTAGPESFLAHGEAGAARAERQPILLSAALDAANGANHVVMADGHFRDTDAFARVFLLFTPDAAPSARKAWSALGTGGDMERAYYAQEQGRWVRKS